MTDAADRRILLVHAHPDDEIIGSGATMARYASEGAHVALVTCTLGEEGEILDPNLEHLGVEGEDALGHHRITELSDAMVILGIVDWRLLGEPHKYRDSGMAGLESNKREDCFWQADLLETALDLVPLIRAQRPQILITYDDFGGYGHPDHIKAHRTAMYAVQLAAAPTFRPDLGNVWDIPKVYWTAIPKSMIRRGVQALRDAGDTSDFAKMDLENIPFGIEDEAVTTAIDGRDQIGKKMAAMRAYPTQISTDSGFFSLADIDGAMATEYFRLIKGQLGPLDEQGHEADLFAGLELVPTG